MFTFFCILQALDCLTTYKILKNGKELNPVMNWLFSKLGIIPGLVVAKAILIGAVYNAPQMLLIGTAVYCGVVGWNTFQLIKGK